MGPAAGPAVSRGCPLRQGPHLEPPLHLWKMGIIVPPLAGVRTEPSLVQKRACLLPTGDCTCPAALPTQVCPLRWSGGAQMRPAWMLPCWPST